MDLLLKTALIFTLVLVATQDIRERKVYWFLFPIMGFLVGALHFQNTLEELFWISVVLNTAFVAFLLLVVYLYSKFKLKVSVKETFGLGDTLLFVALIFTFSTVSFLIIFIGSLLFSLVLHVLIKKHNKTNDVPLAGYMSLFFLFAFIANWSNLINDLYFI